MLEDCECGTQYGKFKDMEGSLYTRAVQLESSDPQHWVPTTAGSRHPGTSGQVPPAHPSPHHQHQHLPPSPLS